MSTTAKYKVFDDSGLQALVNQTKANKIAAGDNSAEIDGVSTDLQEFSDQVTGVFEEVENCLNELDTNKAETTHGHTLTDVSSTNAPFETISGSNLEDLLLSADSAISGKADSHSHPYLSDTTKYAGSDAVGGSATSAVKLDSSAGSASKPVYFKDGKPVECSVSLDADIDCGTF